MQTQLNVVSKDDEDQDLANNNDVIDEDIENEHSNEKSDKLWKSCQINCALDARSKNASLSTSFILNTVLWYKPYTAYLLF